MFALARELVASKGLVITTTTTKIFPPSPEDTPCMLVSEDKRAIKDFILNEGAKHGHITIVSEEIASSGKLKGFDPELIQEVCKVSPETIIIVEADGAAGRPLKAPNIEHEPVIPKNSSLIIPVVGIDALGCELTEEYVFRAAIAARLTGMALGDNVTSEVIVSLMTHKYGMFYGCPVHARVVPFINKTDLDNSISDARALASGILEAGHPQIDCVVLGQAKIQPHVLESLNGRYI